MLRLAKIIKPWTEAGSLNANINLYGFWDETTFLTKSGDLGMILKVCGVDFESLDQAGQEFAVKRLEAALKSFGPGFHVYQYLFKTNRPEMPFARYGDPLIDAAIDQRREFFESKLDHLYEIEIYYAVVLEGARSKSGIMAALGRLPSDPEGAVRELKAQFTSNVMKVLLRSQIQRDLLRLKQRVEAFEQQLRDQVDIEILSSDDQFHFLRRLLNFDTWRIAGKPQTSQYLDFQVVNSDIEAERDHLRIGDHFVRLLTMRESITETRPLVLDKLLKIEANFYAVTEWTPLGADAAKKEVVKRRRHANMSKAGLISSMKDESKVNQRDVLIDEGKQADIEVLGECLRALSDGQTLGDLSLTIVLYGKDKAVTRRENVLLLGNSGTGKTHIALALGLAACQQGHRVRFTTAAALVHELIEARDERKLLRFQKQIASYELLIVDELGFVPLSKTGAELLFEMLSQRYERGSTMLTSNLPFAEWTEVLGSERLTGALLDRLTHYVHILEMNGDSFRLKQSRRKRNPNS